MIDILSLGVQDCQICLESSCCGSMRLIPRQKLNKQQMTNQDQKTTSVAIKCFPKHNHTENIANIEEILSEKYETLKQFTSSLKKLQDFTSILVIIESSFSNQKQQTKFNYQDKEFSNFCVSQAQNIATFYQKFDACFFQKQLRNILLSYQSNDISYKELNVSVNQLIEEYHFMERQIFSPILLYMNKGVLIRDLTTTNSNLFEQVKKFAVSVISLLQENLKKIIIGHSNRLENIPYISLLSFQYLQVITRILKKYFLDGLQSREKSNMIDQLQKYTRFFILQNDIQNALICYNDSLEFNPSLSDLYLQLVKIFKKLNDLHSQKVTYYLALFQFPQKTIFLAGLLESLQITQQNQVSFIKDYQNILTLHLAKGEFYILSQLFKDKDVTTSNIFKSFHESKVPLENFNSIKSYLLIKNLNSKNLNPLIKMQEAMIANEKKCNLENEISIVNVSLLSKKNESAPMISIQEIKDSKKEQNQPIKRKIIKKSVPKPIQETQNLEVIEIIESEEEKNNKVKLLKKNDIIATYKQVEQITKKILKIVKNPNTSKNMQNIVKTNLQQLSDNHSHQKSLSLGTESFKENSTNYSMSNLNMSRSYYTNYIEILSTSNSSPPSPFIHPVDISTSSNVQ